MIVFCSIYILNSICKMNDSFYRLSILWYMTWLCVENKNAKTFKMEMLIAETCIAELCYVHELSRVFIDFYIHKMNSVFTNTFTAFKNFRNLCFQFMYTLPYSAFTLFCFSYLYQTIKPSNHQTKHLISDKQNKTK